MGLILNIWKSALMRVTYIGLVTWARVSEMKRSLCMLNKKNIFQAVRILLGCFLFLMGFLLTLILIGGSFFDLSVQEHHQFMEECVKSGRGFRSCLGSLY